MFVRAPFIEAKTLEITPTDIYRERQPQYFNSGGKLILKQHNTIVYIVGDCIMNILLFFFSFSEICLQ